MALLHAVLGFILAGITLEVFWTSILDFIKKKNPKLKGETYLWMFPIYAVVPFIFIFVQGHFSEMGLFFRGLIYMVSFYLLEFVSGFLIRKAVGVSPWDYTDHSIKLFGRKFKSNLSGLICLEYAPIWFIYGLLGEFYFKFLMGL